MSPQDKNLQNKDLQQEQQLLQHYRQHSQGEPSAAVDALILAAARQAVAPATPSAAQRLHGWLFGHGSRTRWSVAFAGLATLGIGLSLTWRTQEQAPSAYDAPLPMAAQAPVLREMAPTMASQAPQPAVEAQKSKAEQPVAVAGGMEPDAAYAPAADADLARQLPLTKPAAPASAEAVADAVVTQADEQARAYVAAKAQTVAKAQAQEVQSAARAKMRSEEKASMLAEQVPPLELRLRDVLRLRTEGRQDEADKLLQALRPAYPQLDLDAELKRLQGEAEKPASSR